MGGTAQNLSVVDSQPLPLSVVDSQPLPSSDARSGTTQLPSGTISAQWNPDTKKYETSPSVLSQAYQDLKQGQYAKAGHDVITGGAKAFAPLAIPAAAAAPIPFMASAAAGMAGSYGARKGAEKLGATPDQANLAGDVGGLAGGVAGAYGGNSLAEALPSASRAGQAFQDIKASAGNVPIDMKKPGDSALELYEQSQRGAVLPKAVRQFVMRATQPGGEPITYQEAKDFQSNISALSANEKMSMKPNTVRLLGQLNSDLKDSLANAADVAGKGQQFAQAMKEYHNAMTVSNWTDEAKSAAIKAALGGLGLYGIRKVIGLGDQ